MNNIKRFDEFLIENAKTDEVMMLVEGIQIPEKIKTSIEKIVKKYKSKFATLAEKFKGQSVEQIYKSIVKEEPEMATIVANEGFIDNAKKKMGNIKDSLVDYLGHFAVGAGIITMLIPTVMAILRSVDWSTFNQYKSTSLAFTIAFLIFTIVTAYFSENTHLID